MEYSLFLSRQRCPQFWDEAANKHDDRYAVAEEYMEVCYKLWETSWEDNAVLRDTQSGVFTEPEKVHPIGHTENTFKSQDTISANLHPSALPFSIKQEHLGEEKILLPDMRNASLSPHLTRQFLRTMCGISADVPPALVAIRPNFFSSIFSPLSSLRPKRKQNANTQSTANMSAMMARWLWSRAGPVSTLVNSEEINVWNTLRTMRSNLPQSR